MNTIEKIDEKIDSLKRTQVHAKQWLERIKVSIKWKKNKNKIV